MRCRKCRQIVLQAITESGRKVTLDPDPARGGTMRVSFEKYMGRRIWKSVVVPVSNAKQYPGELYRVHDCKGKPCRK